ncbi:MAG: metal ABC transporter permease [Candidatus Sericytochromatia bacterium]|nr:metal ABC transporter permease [Candidatus Sericytochromatia bacterium]MEB3221422.1 metal ABC transporter permease [Candidatus Sericytochromatia bacterium]
MASPVEPAWLSSLWELLTLQPDFLRLSLAGTALIGVSCGVLGCFIILRRLALFGDALGHAVLPGVLLGWVLGGWSYPAIFGGALVAGLVAAGLVAVIPRITRHRPDTAIGVVFTGMFGLGVAILSTRQVGSGGVTSLLFGQALGIGPDDVARAAVLLAGTLLLLALGWRPLQLLTFDPEGAAARGLPVLALTAALMLALTGTVVVSLPIVGALLVVALLVIPGATAFLLVDRFGPMLALAGLVGGLAAFGGLALSHLCGWASGASIVLAAACEFALALVVHTTRRRLRPGGPAARA